MLSGDLIKKVSIKDLIISLLKDNSLVHIRDFYKKFNMRFGKYHKVSISGFRAYASSLPYIKIGSRDRLYGNIETIRREEKKCSKIGKDYISDYRRIK